MIDGLSATESLWCGTRDLRCRLVELPDHPVGRRSLDGALELALNQAKAIPQLGDVRPSGHVSRTLEDEEGREHRRSRSRPDERKMMGGPRQDPAGAGAMKRAVDRRESRVRNSDEENC